nr:helix-turn-helix domain-containing protein [uncultured Roseateles sp.]
MSSHPSALAPLPLPTGESWRYAAQSFDVDQHAAAQPEWQLKYDQLSRGPFRGSIELVQLPGLRLVHEQANCGTRQRGQIGTGHYGFAMHTELNGATFFNGQALDLDSLMIGRSEDLDICSPARFGLVGMVVDAELLGELWLQMYQKPLTRWLELQVVVQARPAMADEVRDMHLKAMAAIAANPALLDDEAAMLQLRDEILITWIEAIPERVSVDYLGSVASRKKLVENACELVLSQQDGAMTMLELCRRVGASQRKLEYCFQGVLGMSPAKYLRAARLNGVRRELKRASTGGPGVQDIAARWGFWRQGEFAADYRRQFGELPSATLATRGLALA